MIRRLLLSYSLLLAGIVCIAQQPHAQLGHFPPGVIQQRAALDASSSGACSQYTSLAARLDGGQNVSATQTLICGLVSDGIWSSMDVFYILATNSSANAILNWVSSSFTITVNGTPTFTANQGYASTGGTGQFLDTGYNPTTNATNCTQNSCSVGLYDRSSRSTGSSKDFGAAGTGNIFLDTYFSGSLFNDVNDTSFNSIATSNAQGQYVSSRTVSTTLHLYKNSSATDLGPFTSTSTGVPNANIYITCVNNSGCDTGTPDQFAAAFVAGGLSAANAAQVMTRINTYMTTLGTNVY